MKNHSVNQSILSLRFGGDRSVIRRLATYIACITVAVLGYAELQNVEVGGELRIRGRYWNNTYDDLGRAIRIPDEFLQLRPIGPFGATSRYVFDDNNNST